MKLNEAYSVFREIRKKIAKLESRYGLEDEYEHDLTNSEESFKHDIAREVTSKLDDVKELLDYVEKTIVAEGRLEKNDNDRYEVQGREITSSMVIDVFDEEFDRYERSAIEHHSDGYYAVALGKDVDLQGVQARVRQ